MISIQQIHVILVLAMQELHINICMYSIFTVIENFAMQMFLPEILQTCLY